MSYSPKILEVVLSIASTCIQAKGILPPLFYASDFARFLSPYLLKCDLTKTPNLKVLSQSLARHQLGLSAFLQGDYSVEEEVFGFAMEELLSEIKPEQFWKNDSLYPLFEAIFKTNRYAELAAVLFRPRGNAPLLAEKLLSCLHSLLFFQFPSCEVSHINMSSL